MRGGLNTAGAIVISATLGACLTSRAQLDRRASFGGDEEYVEIEDVPVRGFEVSVEAHDGEQQYFVDGELLAVDNADLWVLETDGRARAVERAQVIEVQVEVYDQKSGGLVAWTVVGSLSTISHGVLLVFSLPVWLTTGIAASINAEHTDDFSVTEPDQIDLLTQFARFPQGLPPGFAQNALLGRAEWLSTRASEETR